MSSPHGHPGERNVTERNGTEGCPCGENIGTAPLGADAQKAMGDPLKVLGVPAKMLYFPHGSIS
jgi:hypothetical protein